MSCFTLALVCGVIFHFHISFVQCFSCVNDSDVFWKSLKFWDSENLFEKLKIESDININQTCKGEIKDMIYGSHNNSLWALKMLDASGHYGNNIFDGNEFWLGSNTQCQKLQQFRNEFLSMNVSHSNVKRLYYRTQERRIISNNHYTNILSTPPYPIKFAVVSFLFKINSLCHLSNETEKHIRVGLCLPASCNAYDIRNIIAWITNENIMNVQKIMLIPGKYSIWSDYRFYFLCSIFFVFTVLITLGTIADFMYKEHEKYRNVFWFKVLLSFSLISNIKTITSFEVGDDTLAPIHGLKFISMVWVILLHTCLMLFSVSANKKFRDTSESHILFQTISNGNYSVDTFFTLSATLVSFLFFRTISKYSIKKLIGIEGILGNIGLYISMIPYRMIRLSFPYFIVIILTGFLTEQKINISALPLPTKDHINCDKYWWRNALYINTFFPVQDMCMNWSWYLAIDTQFYVLSIPLLLLALRFRIFTIILGTFLLISSWITTALISYSTNHLVDVRDPFAEYDELYDKPWTRLGPYFIGLATGWYLYQINCTLNLHRQLNMFLWICSLSSLLAILYGPLFFPNNQVFTIFYTSLSHSIWSSAVAFILIACVTGNGFWVNKILSWKYMYPLSRISYCVYLVHPLVIRMALYTSDAPYFISIEMIGAMFLGFLVLSLISAAVISLAFESPIVALIRLGHPMRRSQK